MNKTIVINGDTHILTSDVKSVRPVGAEEQAKISERYDVDGTKFKAAVTLKNDDRPILTHQTCEELSNLGLALIAIDNKRMVPAETIISASTLDAEGRKQINDKGYTVGDEFQAKVETTGGLMLAAATPAQIMARKAQALQILGAKGQSGEKPAGSDAQAAPAPTDGVA